MTTPSLYEARYAAEFVLSEDEYGQSRDNIVIASGAGVLVPGTVVGQVTSTGKFVPSPDAAFGGGVTDGSQVASAIILYGVDATSSDVTVAAIASEAQVNGHILTYHSSVTTGTQKAAKVAQLASKFIKVR